MRFATEFKEFAVKGNVMDLAVGVIIGAAFGKIVDSVVNDLIMPLVSKVTGGLDFSNYFIPLAGQTATVLADAKKAGAVFAYGNFITVAINFIILAFIIFLMVKQINKLKKEHAAGRRAAGPDAGRRDAAARDPRLAEKVMREVARVTARPQPTGRGPPGLAAFVQGASRRAIVAAATRLAASATPRPAMSNAVP